jgi:transposase
VRYAVEQRVFLYDTHVKYGYAKKCQQKFRCIFRNKRVSSKQTIHNLVNKVRSTGLITEKHKRRALTEEKLDDIEARLEHTRTPRKSLKRLAQETGVSKSNARWTHNC